MQLVFIHGRAQQGRDPQLLKREWIDALHRGADAAGITFTVRPRSVTMPYYGDTLAELTAAEPDDELAAPPVSAERSAHGGDDLDRDVLIDCLDGAGIDEVAIETELASTSPDDPPLVDDTTEEPEPSRFRSMLAWEWVQTGLSILDRYVPGVSGRSIRWTTHDVAVYLDDRSVRDRINRHVARAFDDGRTNDPVVVVAHSLGSVVAYDLLRPEGTVKRPVHTLVTIGSPLGLRAVRRALAPLDDPPMVRRWLNAYDDRDVIALHPLEPADFPFDPPIENHPGIRNDTVNHHGIEGYLGDPTVATAIVEAVLSDAGRLARAGHLSRSALRHLRSALGRR